MSQVRVSYKELGKNEFLLDVRYDSGRIRPKVYGDLDYVKLVKSCMEIVGNDFILHNIDNFFVKEEFLSKIYELHSKNYSIHHDKSDMLYKASEDSIRILKKLSQKIIALDIFLVPMFLNNLSYGNKRIIKLLLLGQFGTGKTEIVKKISNIPDSIDFPVSDTLRTTTFDSYYIFKKDDKLSDFAFVIHFKNNTEFENNVSDCYSRAIYKSFQCFKERLSKAQMQDIVIHEFVSDPEKLFNIEYVLGKYYELKSEKRKLEKNNTQTNEWNNIYEGIYSLVYNFLSLNCTYKEDTGFDQTGLEKYELEDYLFKDELQKKNIRELVIKLADMLYSKMEILCREMREKGLGEIIEYNGRIIGFKNNNYSLDQIDKYVTPFTSTSLQNFTKIVTPLVKTMAIEIPYNNNINNEYLDNILLIKDTVGFQNRKTEDTISLEGSTNFSYNEFDLIGLVENSKNSINETTEDILRELFYNAHRSKILMLYTFYDEFSKKEFEDEEDKKHFLTKLQNDAVRKISPSAQSDKFITMLESNTIFLKGLMQNTKSDEYKNFANALMNRIINQYRFLYEYKKLVLIDSKKPLITYNYKRLALVFQQAQLDYVTKQQDLYLHNYPDKKITEALTQKLFAGNTYYSGTTRTLKPVDDLTSALMEKINMFINSPSNINFKLSESIEFHKDKVLDWIKEEVSCRIKAVIKTNFVDGHKEDWEMLFNICGIGSDLNRRQGIIDGINEFLPNLDIEKPTFADRWIDEMENIFIDVLSRMTGSITK